MNWIHPFSDGNGRVARSLACLLICQSSKGDDGNLNFGTLFSDIDRERRDDCFAASQSADRLWAASDQDYADPQVVFEMELLLREAGIHAMKC